MTFHATFLKANPHAIWSKQTKNQQHLMYTPTDVTHVTRTLQCTHTYSVHTVSVRIYKDNVTKPPNACNSKTESCNANIHYNTYGTYIVMYTHTYSAYTKVYVQES